MSSAPHGLSLETMNESGERPTALIDDSLWIPGAAPELIPNFEELQAKLQVIRSARDDRRAGMPRVTDTQLNHTQEDIRQTAVDAIRRLESNLMEDLTVAAAHMVEDGEEISAAARIHEVEASLSLIIRIDEPLRRLGVDYLAAGAERDEFVRQNALKPPAAYQEHLSTTVAALWLLMCAGLFMSALMLREVNGYGLIGALGVGLIISTANLALGLAGGVGWRLFGHRRLGHRIAGGGVTAVATVGAVSCNLIAAHYRQVAEDFIVYQDRLQSALEGMLGSLHVDNTAAQFSTVLLDLGWWAFAVSHVREFGWLGLTSMGSWGLAIGGLGIFFAVCYRNWDDYARYWGYRSRDLRRRRSREALDAQLGRIEDCAFGYIDEQLKACDQALKELGHRASVARRIATQAERRYGEAMALVERWGRTANQLLRLYREENAQQFPSALLPTYWEDYWPVEEFQQFLSAGPTSASSEWRTEMPIQTIRNRHRALQSIMDNSRRERDYFARFAIEICTHIPARMAHLRTQVLDQATAEVVHLFPRAS